MFRCFAVLGVVFITFSGFASATIINGDFSNGLNSWNAGSGVTNVSDTAALNDTGAADVSLYQGTAVTPGTHILEFDVSLNLSSSLPQDPFAFLDTFAASLYLFSDASVASQLGNFGDFLNNGTWSGPSPSAGVALLTADSTGVFQNGGNFTAIQSEPGWWHFDYTFSSPDVFAVPVFELFDLNTINNDSEVRIDNVHISDVVIVPEPATVMLLGLGIGGLALRKRAGGFFRPTDR